MTIGVSCDPDGEGWRCGVEIDDGRGVTSHLVSVSAASLERLDPGARDPVNLVHRSFEFLLEREPKESILRQFDLPIIARYFPEYERTIRV